MSESTTDRIVLIDQFIQGCLTEEESESLGNVLRADAQFVSFFQANVRADYLLKEKKRQLCPKSSADSSNLGKVSVRLTLEEVQEIATEVKNCSQRVSSAERLSADFHDEDGLSILDALVAWEKNAPGIPKGQTLETKRTRSFFRGWFSASVSAILILIALWFIVVLNIRELHDNYYSPVVEIEPKDYSVRIAELIDVVWDAESGASLFRRGQYIDSDKLSIKSGILKLEFQSGAMLHLEGPAELVINDRKKSFCQRGQISAYVPPSAVGFEIGTPLGKIIDLGTEYYARVTPENVQMGVVGGRVEVRTKNGQSETIEVGNEVHIGSTLMLTKGVADRSLYLPSDVFQKKLFESVEKFVQKRDENRQPFLKDPGLLFHYRFDTRARNEVPNLSQNGSVKGIYARLNKTSLTSGSLAGQNALQFSRPKDRICIPYSTQLDEMTILISIRLDHLSEKGGLLLSSDSLLRDPGAFIFKIIDGGALQLRVRKEKDSLTDAYSSVGYFNRASLGTWSQLAVVYSLKNSHVSFYADGTLLTTVPLQEKNRLLIKEMLIGGNFKSSSSNEMLFQGAVEEFLLFDKALSSKEIEQMNVKY